MILSRFFIFLSVSAFCYSQEILDVETLPTLRTQRYSMEPYEKIVVFSAYRTGSSLVYNVLRFLFEKDENFFRSHTALHPDCLVLKTHKYKEADRFKNEKVLYVVPIRHPLEASISTYRISSRAIEDPQHWCKEIIESQADHLLFAEKKRAAGDDLVLIRFEDFEENTKYLIDFFENYFYLSISELDKNTIQIGYNKENVSSNVESLSNFKKYLPVSGFHGKHVADEKFTPPAEILYWLNYYLEGVKPTFEKYGYTQSDSKIGR